MYSKFTSHFVNPDIQSDFLLYRASNIKKNFLMFTFICQIGLIITAFENIWQLNVTILSITVAISILQGLSFLYIQSDTKYIDQILIGMQILFSLQHGMQYQIYHLSSIQYYNLGITAIFYEFMIYRQGCNILKSTIILIIVVLVKYIFIGGNSFQIIIIIQTYSSMIALRYYEEHERKKKFLGTMQNRKWNQVQDQFQLIKLIVDFLPDQLVTLCYDEKTTLFKMLKMNSKFKAEFNIEDDFSLRNFIRKLQVFPESNKKVCETPAQLSRINFEQYLIIILKENKYKNINEQFISYLKDGQIVREFKISIASIQSFQPMILLLFEEILPNRYDTLEKQIIWRDKLIQDLSCRNMIYLGKMLAFIKFITRDRRQVAVTNSPVFKFTDIFEKSSSQFLLEGYKIFNQNLNIHTLIQINYNKVLYKIDSINFDHLFNQLSESLGVQIEQQKNQYWQCEQTTQNNNTNPGINSLSCFINDKQKLMQTIITVVQFIEFLLSQNNGIQLNDKIKLSIRQVKLKPSQYAVRIHHKNLRIPLDLENSMNENWSNSELNQHRFGAHQHISQIQQLQECLSNQYNTILEKNNDKKSSAQEKFSMERFIFCGVPIVQHLISQIGPFNIFFLRNKQKNGYPNKQNVENLSNQIKFYIYKNLNEVINDINDAQDIQKCDKVIRQISIYICLFQRNT